MSIRMAVWKHLIVLFGGFYDPGITSMSKRVPIVETFHSEPYQARYLNDLWVFDTHEYKWTQVEFREMEAKPSRVVARLSSMTTDRYLQTSKRVFLPSMRRWHCFTW